MWECLGIMTFTFTSTSTFIHLVDAFMHSDLQVRDIGTAGELEVSAKCKIYLKDRVQGDQVKKWTGGAAEGHWGVRGVNGGGALGRNESWRVFFKDGERCPCSEILLNVCATFFCQSHK